MAMEPHLASSMSKIYELGAFREVEILVEVRGGPPFWFQIAFKSVAK